MKEEMNPIQAFTPDELKYLSKLDMIMAILVVIFYPIAMYGMTYIRNIDINNYGFYVVTIFFITLLLIGIKVSHDKIIRTIYLTKEGIYYERLNGKKGMVPWDRIHRIVEDWGGPTPSSFKVYWIEYYTGKRFIKMDMVGAVDKNAQRRIKEYIRKNVDKKIEIIESYP